MTKVVFQAAGYWLTEQFWEDARIAGSEPLLVDCRSELVVSRPITRTELAARFPSGRAAGWVHSAHKSVSAFYASLAPADRRRVAKLYANAVRAGLRAVAERMTARTGAQGKVRLPVEPGFAVAVHAEAKDGRPQLHAHVRWPERVRPTGQTKTYAAHTRELYQLRGLFTAVVHHEFGRSLRATFGVRVRKVERDRGLVLQDVPKELCRRSSARSQQIADYLRQHGLADTPVARQFAAFATRRLNTDPEAGRRAFHADRERLGFFADRITGRAPELSDPQSGDRRRVLRAARRLSLEKAVWTHRELTERAIRDAPLTQPLDQIRRAVDRVLVSPKRHRLVASRNRHGQPVWTSAAAVRAWRRLARRVGRVIGVEKTADRSDPAERVHPSGRDPKPVAGRRRSPRLNHSDRSARTDGRAEASQSHDPNRHQERAPLSPAKVEALLRACRVIGAVGALGRALVLQSRELYRLGARPVVTIDGGGSRRQSDSLAAVARDLLPIPRLRSHWTALRAMVQHYGTLGQKLAHGEAVYRLCRQPKQTIPKNALVVVRRVGHAAPDDVRVLLERARRARACVLFEDRALAHSQLLRAAWKAALAQANANKNGLNR